MARTNLPLDVLAALSVLDSLDLSKVTNSTKSTIQTLVKHLELATRTRKAGQCVTMSKQLETTKGKAAGDHHLPHLLPFARYYFAPSQPSNNEKQPADPSHVISTKEVNESPQTKDEAPSQLLRSRHSTGNLGLRSTGLKMFPYRFTFQVTTSMFEG